MDSENLADEDIQNAIRQLRVRVKNVISSDVYEDIHLFYRFLKARDFDVDKAEAMFRKNLAWRKAFQVDNVLDRFQPKETFLKYLQPSIIGFDKVGDMVSYVAIGKYEPKNILKCFKLNQYMRHWMYYAERMVLLMKRQTEKTGQKNYRGSLIFDLDKLTFANATDKGGAEITMKFCHLLQDNYPERMKALYIINAPAYYVFLYSIMKRILSNASLQKIQVFGQNGWKEKLLKYINADVLPAFLGGTRTDPDGNPLCLSFVCHGYIFPSKNFLTDKERFFRDRSLVKKIKIQPTQTMKIFVEVTEYGSLIEWEFEVKNKDIGFGLFVQDADDEVEVLPILKFCTSDGTEKDSYKANLLGTYIIIFDNTYSWLNPKEVHYTVTVTKI